MKKLMTSTIILLPLIILAILLVSGAIKALMTHIYVDRVEFVDNETLTLVMDDEENPPSEQLEVNVFPLKAENRAVAFSVDDESIATVDANGKVVAKYYGTTTVTVTSVENKTKFAQKKIVVTDRRVHDIVIHDHAEEMYVGDDSMRLTAEVLPEGADNKNIEWSTDAPADILTVDKTTGFVTCYGSSKNLEGGVATITATSVENPEVTATTAIKCHEPLSGLGIQETGNVVTALKEAQFPEIVPYPADATYAVAYSTSDSGVASVNSEGKITFYKPGQVTVTATATDGRGNSRTVSKDYDCTFGYFAGPLFGTAEKQTYDYDELKNSGGELDIHFTKTPADSYQEILRVEFTGPDLIEYDADTKKFTFKEADDTTPLGTVTITVHAKKYGSNHAVEEFDSDRLEVEFTRKTAELKFESGGEALSSVSVTARSLNLAELKGSASGLGVRAIPENHTDAISYSCESTCASLAGTMLQFTGEGEATVTVSVGEVSATLKVSYAQPNAQDVTVTLDSAEEQSVALDLYEQGGDLKGDNAVLVFGAPDGYEAKIESDNANVIKVEGQKLIPQKGGFANVTVSFVPKAGAVMYALDPQTSYTVHVYVDRPVGAADITFAVENTAVTSAQTFTTAKSEVTLTITVDAKNGAMEGKDLYLDGAAAQQSETQGDKLVYTKTVSFASAQEITVTAAVQYAGTATAVDPEKTGAIVGAGNSCKLRSTEGKLTSGLTVTKDGSELSAAGNPLTFDNLGQTATLNVKVENPEPADFDLETYVNESAVRAIVEDLKANGYLNAEMTVTGNTAMITLTAASAAESQTLHFTIAGQKFALTVTVHVPADQMTVEYSNKPLTENDSYTTFLSELSLRVTLSRKDGKTGGISAAYKKIAATFGGTPFGADNVTPDGDGALSFTVKVKPTADAQELKITAEGGLAVFTMQLEKLTAAEGKFTYYITYTYGLVEDAPEPRFDIKVGEKNNTVFFPRGLTGFELHIEQSADPHRLGDFTDDAPTEHFYIKEEGWTCEYRSLSGKGGYLTVTVPEGKEFFTDEEITFVCPDGKGGTAETTLTLTLPNVRTVSMTGYDNGVATDVYKGYQQVRVFAKHSDYGDGNVVDYYRVPFKAEASVKVETAPGYAVWNISSHNDKTGERKLLATQTWTSVTYYKNGDKAQAETYTIEQVTDGAGAVKPSTLKKGETEIAKGGVYKEGAEQVPWVDVFAEEGYAHIYFGAFTGLSETDIQNDLFGNFGEQTAWEVPYKEGQKNIEGKDVTPSGGAFSYLRVAVGDGTAESTNATMGGGNGEGNTHFNFNVLADTDLVNVFNASGYYARNKLVLQNDLYGNGELDSDEGRKAVAEKNGQIMDKEFVQTNGSSPAEYAKDTVYGNGYQVNLNSLNEMIVSTGSTTTGGMMNHGGQENTGNATHFTSLYNVTMKGRNDNTKVTSAQFAIFFNIKNVYYTDLQNYSKMNPKGGSMTIKNSVLRNVAVQALQLWNEASNPVATRGYWSAYLENVTFVNVSKCISIEGAADAATSKYPTIYLKGFFDVLNYYSFSTLKNMASAVADDEMVVKMLSASLRYGQTLISNYVEWFGQNQKAAADLTTWNQAAYGGDGEKFKGQDKVFVNPIIVDTAIDGKTKLYGTWGDNVGGVGGKIMSWNGTAYVDAMTNTNGVKVAHPLSGLDHNASGFGQGLITAYTYASTNESDGGHVDEATTVSQYDKYQSQSDKVFRVSLSRNLGKLFTEERDIRLLCQYLDVDGEGNPIRNDDHILWHMQKVYRDLSLVNKGPNCVQPEENAREPDHITALKQSLTDARDRDDWDGTWPDNTTLQQALDAAAPALAMNELLSETVIPSKRAY